jgi:hypothetical protein
MSVVKISIEMLQAEKVFPLCAVAGICSYGAFKKGPTEKSETKQIQHQASCVQFQRFSLKVFITSKPFLSIYFWSSRRFYHRSVFFCVQS